MATFNFALSDGSSYAVKTVLETESGFFIDPFNNDAALDAWTKYRTEQEEEAFRNQPPELFKFYEVKYCDENGRNYTQLLGAESQGEAIALLRKAEKVKKVEIIKSYEKYCNLAALTMDEVAAQCYGLF